MVSGYRKKKHLPTVRRIPDEVWNEVRRILPPEKPSNTKICLNFFSNKGIKEVYRISKNPDGAENSISSQTPSRLRY